MTKLIFILSVLFPTLIGGVPVVTTLMAWAGYISIDSYMVIMTNYMDNMLLAVILLIVSAVGLDYTYDR